MITVFNKRQKTSHYNMLDPVTNSLYIELHKNPIFHVLLYFVDSVGQ
jgi:hypothetical protein